MGLFYWQILADPRQGRFVLNAKFKTLSRALLICASLCLPCATGLRAAQAKSPAAPEAPLMHEVTDGYGRTVRIPVNPQRIISLAPSLTETLYDLGVQDRLVGDTDYCDYPPDAKEKTKVGGVINPNLEQIAALHPDLILMSKEGNMLETVRALDSLGIPNYATDAHTIEQIISSTQKLADVLNVSAAGKALTEDLRQRLATLEEKLNGVTSKRVLFIVWPEPLMSVGKNTFVADALRRAGAVSIVDSNQDWPQVSLEEVVRLQPEYLIFAPSHTGSSEHDIEALESRPDWKILNAVQNRRFIIASDAIVRTAPRIVSVIEELARQLHPDVFRETSGPQKETSPANAPAAPQPPKPSGFLPIASPCSAESSCAL
jgi:iron complex transport system substrate-binding protein